MFVMVGCMRDELLAMRSGLTDVIPPELLEGLTAEVSAVTSTALFVTVCYNGISVALSFLSKLMSKKP